MYNKQREIMTLSKNTLGLINHIIKESGVDYAQKTFEDLMQKVIINIDNHGFNTEGLERNKTFLMNYKNVLSYIKQYKRELILKELY